MGFVTDLDTPLMRLSPSDVFTLRDACNGVHIFGGIGSGKTSGSGRTLASAYLRAGMGGLVLCAKLEEVRLWQDYAKAHGRSQSVLVFDETQGFNFIDYELARQGMQGIANVTECLMRVLEAADHATGTTGKGADPFWEQTARQVLNYTIPVLYSAYGKVTVADIIDFVSSAATQQGQYDDAAWAARSYAANTLTKAVEAPEVPLTDKHAVMAMASYWYHQYPAIPEKTRGNIQISLSTRLDRFRHGRLRQAFGDRTTLVPELTFHGIIIVMAMPALTWNEDGIIGQQLFKFLWQRAVEARNGLSREQSARPVFLWADEAQYFVNLKDDEFLSTCRSARACVVFLTQTLPTYYAKLGKERSDAADGLVGKFTSQVFHLNACSRTNRFAADLIGRVLQTRNTINQSVGSNRSRGMNQGENASSGTTHSSGSSGGPGGGGWNSSSGSSSSYGDSWGTNVGRGENISESWGTTEQMDYLIEPRFFANNLKSGGPAHGNKVTAVWFRAGGNFKVSGGNALLATFQQ